MLTIILDGIKLNESVFAYVAGTVKSVVQLLRTSPVRKTADSWRSGMTGGCRATEAPLRGVVVGGVNPSVIS